MSDLGGQGGAEAEALHRASVCVGPVETWYASWGRGDPVVVFLERPLVWASHAWLSGLAGPRARLILPEVSAAAESDAFSRWFSDFLDGLGLEAVRVAAEPRFEPLLLAAMQDHARIEAPILRVSSPYRAGGPERPNPSSGAGRGPQRTGV